MSGRRIYHTTTHTQRERPVDEPLPHDVADQARRDPRFQGRCYLCGTYCNGIFCHAHQWAKQ